MKKALIVMLSVMLVLTFVACEKDKSGEVVQNYEDFVVAYNASDVAGDCATSLAPELYSDKTTNKDVSKSTLNAYSVANWWKKLTGDDITVDSTSLSQEGTITGTTALDTSAGTGKIEAEVTGVKVKFKYTKSGSTDKLDGEISFSGKLTLEVTKDSRSYSYSSFSLNGVSYKDISFTQNMETKKFTAAKIGGADVELKLLNNQL
jgi:hypothetical protein